MTRGWLPMVALLGCGSPTVPAVPAPSAAPRVQVEVPATPPPTAEPRIDDPAAMAQHLQALCDAAARGDEAEVRRLAVLPLRGHERISADEPPQLGGIFFEEDPASVARRALCEAPSRSPLALSDVRRDGARVRALFAAGPDHYRLTFEGDPPRLTEQSYVLARTLPPPPVPTTRELVIAVAPRGEVTDDTRTLAASAEASLQADPRCLAIHAQREPVGATAWVVVTGGGGMVEVDVYASTVAPASLMACVDHQLRARLSTLLSPEGPRREHELWLQLGVVVSDDEIPDGAAILEMAPP